MSNDHQRCLLALLYRTICKLFSSYIFKASHRHGILPWHLHPKILSTYSSASKSIEASLRFHLTTVIGMEAAFGKTKAISSNLPRRLKFSATGILRGSEWPTSSRSLFSIPKSIPACSTMANQRKFWKRRVVKTHLSPNP